MMEQSLLHERHGIISFSESVGLTISLSGQDCQVSNPGPTEPQVLLFTPATPIGRLR